MLFVLSPYDLFWDQWFYGTPENPLSPAVAELVIYRKGNQKTHETIIQKRQSDLSSRSHRHPVFVMNQDRNGQTLNVADLPTNDAVAAHTDVDCPVHIQQSRPANINFGKTQPVRQVAFRFLIVHLTDHCVVSDKPLNHLSC